jgi:hypothetical protein
MGGGPRFLMGGAPGRAGKRYGMGMNGRLDIPFFQQKFFLPRWPVIKNTFS